MNTNLLDINANSNFGGLPTNEPRQLNITIDIGYLNIPTKSSGMQFLSENLFSNPFFPPPGGDKGLSYNPKVLKKFKSANLNPLTNGVRPNNIDPVGAPYCTFIIGSIVPGEVHPYYNLIKGPSDSTYNTQSYNATTTTTFTQNPSIVQNSYSTNNFNNDFNKLGKPYIPSTDLISPAIQSLTKNNSITPQTTYNIWSVDNLNKDQFTTNLYTGYTPLSGTQSSNLQPYAKTWTYYDTAQVQVYSSNAQVQLTRLYPISKDYVHIPGNQSISSSSPKYLIYQNQNGQSNLNNLPVGLKEASSGFTIDFSSIVVSDSPPISQNTTNGNTVYAEPRLFISWGNQLDVDINNLNNNNPPNNIIQNYVLDLTPNRPPRLYFNTSSAQIQATTNYNNQYFVELKSLQQIATTSKNPNTKDNNKYLLHVHYSGGFLYISNSNDASKFETIGQQNINGLDLIHNLNNNAKVRINAQQMNFTFGYGPALFNPHDDQNIPGSTYDPYASSDPSDNTYNFVQAQFLVGTDDNYTQNDLKLLQSQLQQSINQNSTTTFQQYNNSTDTANNSNTLVPSSHNSICFDARSVNSNFTVFEPEFYSYSNSDSFDNYNLLSVKITLPTDLGGHTFNHAHYFNNLPLGINKSYVSYDLTIPDRPDINISQVLSTSVISESFKITKQIKNFQTMEQKLLGLKFINLNQTDYGQKIVNFMRKNICAIRVSAGMNNDSQYTYFEGIIQDIKIHDKLDYSEMTLSAQDLMTYLFRDENTSIVSRNSIKFPGMFFSDAIQFLVSNTELYNHFVFDINPKSSFYNFFFDRTRPKSSKINYLPSNTANFLFNNQLSAVSVKAYDTKDNYYKVLETIAQLSVCSPLNQGFDFFEIPILYWSAGYNNNNDSVDGIVFSTRTDVKDTDNLVLYPSTIADIRNSENPNTYLHGHVLAGDQFSEGFESNSNAERLHAQGQYRYVDRFNNPKTVYIKNPNAFAKPVTIDTKGYVGYNKTAFFNNETESGASSSYFGGKLSYYILADDTAALEYINKFFKAYYANVYENVSLDDVLVTKPLKEWGSFNLAYYSSGSLNVFVNYLYESIDYNFNLPENMITATVKGVHPIIS